ncbi:MAG: hypothetical protein ACTS7E_02785 [Arsenophonus sp. NC-CH8-MAG3]
MLINFMDDFNIILMILYEKSTLQVSAKLNISSDLFHEIICNDARLANIAAVEPDIEAILQ